MPSFNHIELPPERITCNLTDEGLAVPDDGVPRINPPYVSNPAISPDEPIPNETEYLNISLNAVVSSLSRMKPPIVLVLVNLAI